MKYIMILCIVIAIAILAASIAGYLKIKKYLHSEIYSLNKKYNIVSNLYVMLIVFFLLAYTTYLVSWIRRPCYNHIVYIVFALLFFGSIFVGISVLVLGQSLMVVMGVKLHEVDTMTGLLTKSSFEKNVQKILDEGHGNYVLAVIDMDNFKMINDMHGHEKGDEVIQATADIIRNTVRAKDMVGRFGGDEFLVLFQEITENQVTSVMSRIEQAIIQEKKRRGCKLCGGISYGTAIIKGGSSGSFHEAFKKADEKLYGMKKDKKTDLQ